jgi:hypothetical protein
MKPFVLALCGFALVGAANASPCGEKIAALQQRYDKLQSAGVVSPDPAVSGATAPETTGALLHHQPTAASVAGAENSADSRAATKAAKFQVDIEQARAAEDSGDFQGCESAAADAEKALTP